jgi:dihydrofolate reductase
MINALSMIAALDANNGIGKNNDLMWNLPADMQFFKDSTKGHVVIMGRKNYDSIPEKFRPLPGRTNVVLSRQANFAAEGCLVFDSLTIGGAQIYALALESGLVKEIFLTHIDKTYGADTFFPDFDATAYKKSLLFKQGIDEKHEANFEVYQYTK